jgi:pimeloyl-ACP methyl ester carboxylesterase
MPFLTELFYRDQGAGQPPVVVLHGGWGYGFYPFDNAIAGIARRFIIPDRRGYGRSPPRDDLPPGFHLDYARETLELLNGLGIERAVFWGHSDGAVIAVHLALTAPARCAAIILEALHVDREKPRSREFFTRMANDPDAFGARVTNKLEADLGPAWRNIIRADGRAWLDIARTPGDLYGGRLRDIRVPTLVLHGSDDPRTEPGELDMLRGQVPHAEIHIIKGGQHSPHSERDHAATCTRIVAELLDARR